MSQSTHKDRYNCTNIKETTKMQANEVLKRYVAGKRNFRQADLKGISLTKTDLNGIDLSGAHLNNADLSNSDFSTAKL